MNREQPQSIEEQKQTALKELLEVGSLWNALQFDENVLGNIRDDRIPADTPQEEIRQTKEDLKVNTRKKVLELKQRCFDLGITQDEIKAAVDDWEREKEASWERWQAENKESST